MQETVVEPPLSHEDYNNYLLMAYFVQMYETSKNPPPQSVFSELGVSDWVCVSDATEIGGQVLADGRPDFSNVSPNVTSVGYVVAAGTRFKVGLWTFTHGRDPYELVHPKKLLDCPIARDRFLKLVGRRVKLQHGRSRLLSYEQINRLNVGERLIKETIGHHGWRADRHLSHTANYDWLSRTLLASPGEGNSIIIACDTEWDDAIVLKRRTYNALRRKSPKKLERVIRIAGACLYGARSHAIRLE